MQADWDSLIDTLELYVESGAAASAGAISVSGTPLFRDSEVAGVVDIIVDIITDIS